MPRLCRAVRARAGALVVAGLILAVGAAPGVGASTSESTVVTAEVLSATEIDVVTGCATGSAAASFGQLMPGTENVTGAPCTVTFGSSNDTAMLSAYQPDGQGDAMWRVADGDLDVDFDTDGTRSYDQIPGWHDSAEAVAIQPDGKILIVGRGGDQMTVQRLLPDGTPDNSFSGNSLDHAGTAIVNDAWSIALQPDGKILVGGRERFADEIAQVVRFNADGGIDTSYGSSGYAAFDVTAGARLERVVALHVDSGGGAIGVIEYENGGFNLRQRAFRLTPGGVLDTDWGVGGFRELPFPAGAIDVEGTLMGDDDKLVAVCWCQNNFGYARINADGSMDTTFGGGGTGVGTTDIGGSDYGQAVVELPDGSYLIAGNTDDGEPAYDGVVIKLTPLGVLDTSYSGDGISDLIEFGAPGEYDDIFAMATMHDGSVLVAGLHDDGASDSAVARVDADGSLDPTFGTGGTVTFDAGALGQNDVVRDMAVGVDGGIVLAGKEEDGEWSALVSVLEAEPVDDYSDGVNDWDTAAPNDRMFGACLAAATAGATGGGGGWIVDAGGDCAATDGDDWYPIADSSGSGGAKVAESLVPGTTGAQADILFGFRTATDQSPGTYNAPVVFEATAPNV